MNAAFNKKIFKNRSLKDLIIALGPSTILIIIVLALAYHYVDPSPPSHLIIATGDHEGDYQLYAKQYQEILKKDGVDLEIKASEGPADNLRLLENEESDIDVAFMQDGLGSPTEESDIVSLGSLYYEPLWIFYRTQSFTKNGILQNGNPHSMLTRFTQLEGKKVGIGREGRGTHILAKRILQESGIQPENSKLISIGSDDAAQSLKKGELDAAFFLLTADDPLIEDLLNDPQLALMNVDQAEAISRQIPYLHHLVIPHGSIDLKHNLPEQDTHLISTTATLLVRDDLHPALAFLLLKAASQIHKAPGILEKRDEFPMNKDDQFPLSDDARQFYKSGGPFWQKYLPFWLAAWIDRFILLVIPLIALILPLLKLIPRIYHWRLRSHILKQYGELKYIETQMRNHKTSTDLQVYRTKLDDIEDKVNRMKLPLDYSEHIYSLKGHIEYVRGKIQN